MLVSRKVQSELDENSPASLAKPAQITRGNQRSGTRLHIDYSAAEPNRQLLDKLRKNRKQQNFNTLNQP